MDTVTARERLEEMRGQIDRSIMVLQGEHPSGRAAADSPQDPADAGTTLSETDRTEAALAAVQSQRRLVMDALVRIERGRLRDVRRLRQADPRGTAGCQAGGGPLRRVPVQAGPPPLSGELAGLAGPRPRDEVQGRGHRGVPGVAPRASSACGRWRPG